MIGTTKENNLIHKQIEHFNLDLIKLQKSMSKTQIKFIYYFQDFTVGSIHSVTHIEFPPKNVLSYVT